MPEQRDWSPHEIGNFSLGRWSGDVLHLAGIVAMYPGSGRAVRGYADIPEDVAKTFRADHISVDIREEGIIAQTWAIFDLARQHLENEGLSLSNIVHMLVLFTSLPPTSPGITAFAKRSFPRIHRPQRWSKSRSCCLAPRFYSKYKSPHRGNCHAIC